jgi:hypothetical protein
MITCDKGDDGYVAYLGSTTKNLSATFPSGNNWMKR